MTSLIHNRRPFFHSTQTSCPFKNGHTGTPKAGTAVYFWGGKMRRKLLIFTNFLGCTPIGSSISLPLGADHGLYKNISQSLVCLGSQVRSLCGYDPDRSTEDTLSSLKGMLEWFRQVMCAFACSAGHARVVRVGEVCFCLPFRPYLSPLRR